MELKDTWAGVRGMPANLLASAQFAVLAVLAVLAACGGGGEGSSSPPASNLPPITAPVAFVDLLPPQTNAVGTYADVQRLLAFDHLNDLRTKAGLGVLYQSASLDAAAQAHAEYLSVNNVYGHYETPGTPGFTGADHLARMAAAGYRPQYGTEVVSFSTRPMGAVALLDALVGTPYHRMAMMRYRVSDAGVGFSTGFPTNVVVKIAHTATNPQGAPSTPAILWPGEGSTGVPLSGCCEEPDPAPELAGKPWGYPVSVQTHESKVLAVTSFTLEYTPAGAGAPTVVATKLLSFGTDPNLGTSVYNARHVAFALPLAPLLTGTTYTARFEGTIDGAAYSRVWSFTTATP